MTRLVVASGLALWVGMTLLLSQLRWFARPPLADRLRPYAPLATRRGRPGLLSVESFRDVIGPLSATVGQSVARLFGATEDLGTRLARIHSPLDPTTFRVRQMGRSAAVLGLALAAAAAIRPPPVLALLALVGLPLLAFLVTEQQLLSACTARQRRLEAELPVLAEQLAMLLSSGFSLGAALNRLAERGTGVGAQDLVGVCGRIRQGLSEADALAEWSALARIDGLDRLVPVLSLNRQTTDLGRLISDEARSIRKAGQRRLLETMEKRSEQVWIPVTVATLVPGAIFLSIPFLEALRLFTGS